MNRRRIHSSAGLIIVQLSLDILILGCLVEVTRAQAGAEATYLSAQHRDVVERWLARRPDLRLATANDCTNKSGLAAMRKEKGRNYHPYYAVGDFNGDGREDFAVALINKKKRRWKFAVAVFNGPVRTGSAPSFLDEQSDLSDGGFSVGSVGKGKRLIAGTFESDNCVVLQSSRRGYTWKNCLE